ncbi:MAG: hypothetical protein RIT81_12860 [Deltaproteobacteria bacterium]
MLGQDTFHREPNAWRRVGVEAEPQPFGWKDTSDDVWAVHANRVVHWDGRRWTIDNATVSFYAVRRVAPDDVWAVGQSGYASHFDGTGWTPVETGVNANLVGLWSSGPDDVWAVGTANIGEPTVVLHWDGASWTRDTSVPPGEASSVWGAAFDDVWVGGRYGTFLHWDGARWSEVTHPTGNVFSISGVAANDIWAGSDRMMHYDGRAWTAVDFPSASSILSVHAVSAAEAWAVTQGGGLFRWDGTAWLETGTDRPDLFGVSAVSPSNAWVSGADGALMRWDGEGWERSRGDLPAQDLCDLTLVDDDLGWAVGAEGTIGRWDGQTWTTSPIDSRIHFDRVWADRERAFAVGHEGIARWTSGSWALMDAPGSRFTSVDGSTGRIWATGRSPSLMRWEEGLWQSFDWPEGATRAELHGTSGTCENVWAVGAGGTILHFDGTTWREVDSSTDRRLFAVHAAAADDVWAVGEHGAIVRFDGEVFRPVRPDWFGPNLTSVRPDGEGGMWVAGLNGFIGRWRPAGD